MTTSTAPAAHTDEDVAHLAAASFRIVTELQDPGGAYPACPTFSAYRGYAWLRDGSFTAEGVSRYGGTTSAERYHDWVSRVLVARRRQVDALTAQVLAGHQPEPSSMLPTRFTFDGADGSDPWWDFQTDGYGTWLWSLVEHGCRHGADLGRWADGVEVAVDYLVLVGDRACYDWWEEHVEHRHVSTLAAVAGGLRSAASSGVLDAARTTAAQEVADRLAGTVLAQGTAAGHLTKWLGTDEVDGSLPSCIVPFGLVEVGSPLATGTLAAVARDLEQGGGVHRFRADVFYGGGRWPLLSCLLGWNLAAAGDDAGARRLLDWAGTRAGAGDHLPEQVDGHLLHPGSRAEWLERWGPVASPLLWSHGMYLILADVLGLLPEQREVGA